MSVAATLIGTTLLGQVSHQAKGSFWLGAPFFLAALMQFLALNVAYRHLLRDNSVQ